MFDKDRFLYSIQSILQKPIESNMQLENVKYYTVLISVEDEIVEERVVSNNLQGEYNLPQVKWEWMSLGYTSVFLLRSVP